MVLAQNNRFFIENNKADINDHHEARARENSDLTVEVVDCEEANVKLDEINQITIDGTLLRCQKWVSWTI